MATVAVIDYGMGNLHSIAKALQHVADDQTILVTSDPTAITNADRIVLPGVGAMHDCIQALNTFGLIEPIKTIARTKPFLGICLGMQALLSDSQENGNTACLNLISGHVLHFKAPLEDAAGNRLKVPHMGWNEVKQTPHPLWAGIPDYSRFYFVHSYYALPDDATTIAGSSHYPTPFACALMKDNLFAVQFHPEKSQDVGLKLLRNFISWNGIHSCDD
jgi:glutamine amidotransferase